MHGETEMFRRLLRTTSILQRAVPQVPAGLTPLAKLTQTHSPRTSSGDLLVGDLNAGLRRLRRPVTMLSALGLIVRADSPAANPATVQTAVTEAVQKSAEVTSLGSSVPATAAEAVHDVAAQAGADATTQATTGTIADAATQAAANAAGVAGRGEGGMVSAFVEKVVELRKELVQEAIMKNPEMKDKLMRAEELSDLSTDPITGVFMRLINTARSLFIPDAPAASAASTAAEAAANDAAAMVTAVTSQDVSAMAGFAANHSWALGIVLTTALVKLTLSYLSTTQFRHYAAIRAHSLRHAVQIRLASIAAAVGPTAGRDSKQIAELRNAVRLQLAMANPDSQDPLKVPIQKPGSLKGVRVIGHSLFWSFAGFPFLFLLNAVYNLPQHPGVKAEMAAETFFHLDSLLSTDPTYVLPAVLAATWLWNLRTDIQERKDYGFVIPKKTFLVASASSVGLPILFHMSGFTAAMYLMLISHNIFAYMLTQFLRNPSVQKVLNIEDVRPAMKEWELLFRPPGLNDPAAIEAAKVLTDARLQVKPTAPVANASPKRAATQQPPHSAKPVFKSTSKPSAQQGPATASTTLSDQASTQITEDTTTSIVGDDAPSKFAAESAQQKLQQRLYQEQLKKQIEEQERQFRLLQAQNIQKVADRTARRESAKEQQNNQ